jgi:hypothetical protein
VTKRINRRSFVVATTALGAGFALGAIPEGSRRVGAAWPTSQAYACITDDDRTAVETYTGIQHKALRRFMPDMDSDILSQPVKDYATEGRLSVVSFQP